MIHPRRWILLVVCGCVLLAGCDSTTQNTTEQGEDECVIREESLREDAQRDQIEALVNPPIVSTSSPDARSLGDGERVIGLLVGSRPLAVPHRVLFEHEIVNLDDWADRSMAVTYCPLTGSSLAFGRDAIDGAEFGVSGLLYNDNLVMFDRRSGESLWPQMSRSALCGPNSGTGLDMIPVLEVQWGRWKELHPSTRVVVNESLQSSRSSRDPSLAMSDEGLAPKIDEEEIPLGRVLGIPVSTRVPNPEGPGAGGGIAFPFAQLGRTAPFTVVDILVSGNQAAVFYDREAQAAMAYATGGDQFSVVEGVIQDQASGSTWAVNGRAIDGPRRGQRLTPIATAFVALGPAWADFYPSSTIWSPSSGTPPPTVGTDLQRRRVSVARVRIPTASSLPTHGFLIFWPAERPCADSGRVSDRDSAGPGRSSITSAGTVGGACG